MNREALHNLDDGELEYRLQELLYANRQAYPIRQSEITDIKEIQKQRREQAKEPLPKAMVTLEAFLGC